MNREHVGRDGVYQDTGGIAGRAAGFVRLNHTGPHATKRIARAFGISLGMAKKLCAGRGWTVARLDQAATLFGDAFREFVWPPPADEIRDRLDRIEQQIAELLAQGRGE